MQFSSQKHDAKFQPRTISFTVESQEEYEVLRVLFRKCITVPDFVQSEEFISGDDVTKLQNFMRGIHHELCE